MKESTLLEMKNRIDATGRILQQLINELEHLKTLAYGNHQVMKRLPEYNDIIKQLQEENGKEEDTSGAATGSSGSTTPNLELE